MVVSKRSMSMSKRSMSTFEIPVFQNQHFSKIHPAQKGLQSGLFECSFLWLTHFAMLTKKLLKSEKMQFWT